ncbi:hypothetical protein PCL_00007 [Purpureocillium lilacinum]|uniref:Uncharacterized protein n=1 Tax=Purpureocillium lilacinum TaxID=33203 RepID=A0A2U3DPA5_PURLI|nr:hypothetical protein PCL_00007 [Purpureocillium lilacinum]
MHLSDRRVGCRRATSAYWTLQSVRRDWLSSKRIEKSRLSDVRQWPSMERARDGEDGEDDIIKVRVEDMDSLDGNWDKQSVQDEIPFIRSLQET